MLLKNGSSGHQVIELQEGLEALGYELGNCDGAFGPATEKAVKAFQEAQGLKVDGLVGRGTIASLNKLLEASRARFNWRR
jgi:peptidoglycan hydrolase-like protein with peptidoglycan-binding domain